MGRRGGGDVGEGGRRGNGEEEEGQEDTKLMLHACYIATEGGYFFYFFL